jgi:hypothetical protein
MNIFKVLKIKAILSVGSLTILTILAAFFMKELKIKILRASMKKLQKTHLYSGPVKDFHTVENSPSLSQTVGLKVLQISLRL